MNKINVLTVFYKNNSQDYFVRYLESIKVFIKQNNIVIECYVLDNSPTPYLKKYISANAAENPKWLHIEERDLNGFASSNNYLASRSYKHKKCDYFLILNPDTEIGTIDLSKVYKLIRSKDFFSVDFRQYPFEHPKEYDEVSGETSWCSGACLLVDAEKFLKIGGFDETFFMYAEDVDLSWRAWESGYKCYYAPESLVVHHCYGVEKNQLFRQYWNIRNGLLMRIKHGSLYDIVRYFKSIVHSFRFALVHGHINECINIAKAMLNGMFIGTRYLDCLFIKKVRPAFAQFYGYDYAKLMRKYEKR